MTLPQLIIRCTNGGRYRTAFSIHNSALYNNHSYWSLTVTTLLTVTFYLLRPYIEKIFFCWRKCIPWDWYNHICMWNRLIFVPMCKQRPLTRCVSWGRPACMTCSSWRITAKCFLFVYICCIRYKIIRKFNNEFISLFKQIKSIN